MKENTTTTVDKAKFIASLTRGPVRLDGLPVSYDQSFAIEFSAFGPVELKKALTDSEMVTSLLRENPTEMAEMINHILGGRTDAAKATALRIGFTEEAFQKNGGGMLFWLGIALCGGFILGYAAFS